MENLTVGNRKKTERKGPMQGLEGTEAIPQSQRVFFPPSNVSAGRRRGRPLGSKNRKNVTVGRNIPHQVISVNRGEDVLEKILTISQKGSRIVTILNVDGYLSSVAVRHPGSPNIMLYEGHFCMISLSCFVVVIESEIVHSTFSITFGGSDGRLYGGEVVGPLIAASPIQVVVKAYPVGCPSKRRNTNVEKPSAITLPSTSSEGRLPHASGEQETSLTLLPVFIKPEPEELD